MHVNYSTLEEKKWGWAKMNIQGVVSEDWRTQANHARLPGFPPPATVTDHVLEEMPCISKPASEMLLETVADFSLALAVVLTHFLERSRINYGYNISHTIWKPAYLGVLTASEENYGMARGNAKNLHKERLTFGAFLSTWTKCSL